MLLQTMGQVNDDCRAVVINQTEFVVNKVGLFIALFEYSYYFRGRGVMKVVTEIFILQPYMHMGQFMA